MRGRRFTTLTFDAGQNSEPNFTRLAALGLHFVGSVPPSDHPGLLARLATDRHLVPSYAEENLAAFETTAMVLGQRRRVILTHSPGLHTAAGQVGFAQTLHKATAALTELADRWPVAVPADPGPGSRPTSTPSAPPDGSPE